MRLHMLRNRKIWASMDMGPYKRCHQSFRTMVQLKGVVRWETIDCEPNNV